MISVFQQFEFSYPNGFLFYDRAGTLARRLQEQFPGLVAKNTELNQRDFSVPGEDLNLFFGGVTARFQSFAYDDNDFSKKASTFLDMVSETFEIAQLSRFGFRHVLARACSSKEEAQKRMWLLIGEEQKAKMASVSPLPSWNSIQGEFTRDNLTCESRIAVMDLTPHAKDVDASRLTTKMQKIILPKIKLVDASVDEAIEFLRIKSRELDIEEVSPSKRGINIVLDPAAASSGALLTLELHKTPIEEVIRYILTLADLKLKFAPDAIHVVPQYDLGYLPHITSHFQANGELSIGLADFDAVAFMENIRSVHSTEILSKLAPDLL